MTRAEMDTVLSDAKSLKFHVDLLYGEAFIDRNEDLAEKLDAVRMQLNGAINGLQAASKYVKG